MKRDDDVEAFAAPWEAKAFALTVGLHQAGLFEWTEWTRMLGDVVAEREAAGGTCGHYDAWLTALERLLTENHVIAAPELRAAQAAWREAAERTPHGAPIELSGD